MKTMAKKLWMLFFAAVLSMMLTFPTEAADIVVVLDPGHGGTEAGATRGSYKEEIINQKIANYLKNELETYSGVKVYMTRTSVTQKAQLRDERVNFAKKKNATVLVSLHINSTAAKSQTSVTGAFVCVPSEKFTSTSAVKSRALARSILSSLNSYVGLKNNGFWYDDELGIIVYGQKSNWTAAQAAKFGTTKAVLNKKIPTMIVEHAFINNPNDRKNYLTTDAQIKKMAVADAIGIANYYRLSKKDGSTPARPAVQTGLVKKGSSAYLYDSEGYPRTGVVKYKGKYYCALEDGKLVKGWKTVNGKRYYFDKTTYAARIGWQKIGKYKYYFTKKGVAKKKWAVIDGVRYFFGKTTGKLQVKKWVKDNGKWYYMTSKGTPYTKRTKKIKGKKYYFDANGVCTNK